MAYTVKKGDTPGKIAKALGVSVEDIMAIKGAFSKPGDARTLQIGATIDLEGGGGGDGGKPQETYTGDEDVRFHGAPGRPEVWKDITTGKSYIVFFVPGIEPEIPMIWEIADDEQLQSYFGEGNKIAYDRQTGTAEFNAAGALNFGTADEIVLRGENPYAGWESQFEREREVLPFLNDPEVAAIMASAWMEGRRPTEAELASAEWFKSKTGGEQQWYTLLATQPKTAEQMRESNKLLVRRELENAGVYAPPDSMVNYIAEQWTTGLWTDEKKSNQIALAADPLKAGKRDQGLTAAVAGVSWDTTAQNERFIDTEILRMLGPVYGNWSKAQRSEWGGRLRNNPDGRDEFANELQRQRLAMFPEYENELLSYEDIATPWRNMAFNAWGQNMDESSALFQNIIKANDTAAAGQMLRSEGLNQGVKQVEDSFLSDIGRSFGGGVRGYAR